MTSECERRMEILPIDDSSLNRIFRFTMALTNYMLVVLLRLLSSHDSHLLHVVSS